MHVCHDNVFFSGVCVGQQERDVRQRFLFICIQRHFIKTEIATDDVFLEVCNIFYFCSSFLNDRLAVFLNNMQCAFQIAKLISSRSFGFLDYDCAERKISITVVISKHCA